jgi:hypothetical protein
MQYPIQIVACLLFLVALAPSPIRAQVRDGASSFDNGAQADGESFIRWQWAIGAAYGSGTVALPFDVPGDIVAHGANRLLVSGISAASGAGYVSQIDFTASAGGVTATLASSVTTGTRDPYWLWTSGDTLLAIDYNALTLECGDLSSGLGSMSLATIATQATLPLLSHQGVVFMLSLESELAIPENCVVAYHPDFSVIGSPRYRVKKQGGVWTISLIDDTSVALPPVWGVEVLPFVAANQSDYLLRVATGTGAFLIRDIDTNAIVYTDTHTASPAGAEQQFIVPGNALVYGHRYRVESNAAQVYGPSTFFRMFQQWGRSVAPIDVEVDRVFVRWDYPSVGLDTIGWNTKTTSNAQPLMLVGCYVGSWDYGVNPTAPSGIGFDVLAQQYGMLGPITVAADFTGFSTVGFSLNVNNPIFTGSRIAFHFVGLRSTSEFVTSDVEGVVLH